MQTRMAAIFLIVCAPYTLGCNATPAENESSTPEAVDLNVTMVKTDEAHTFSGPYGLNGAITKAEAGWLLTGAFAFPNPGYSLEEPQLQILKRLPEHVIIELVVNTPAPDGVFAQVITEAAFEEALAVHEEATFEVNVRTSE